MDVIVVKYKNEQKEFNYLVEAIRFQNELEEKGVESIREWKHIND